MGTDENRSKLRGIKPIWSNKKLKKKRNRKIIIIVLGVFLIIFFVLFGAKLYLTFKALIGNDLIVKIIISPSNLNLNNSMSAKVNLQVHTISNPFCDNHCNYQFVNLANGNIIENGSFYQKVSGSFSREYELFSPKIGSGQELYRFNVQCKSIKNYLCDTNELSISRIALVSLNYDLTKDEKILQINLKERLINLTKRVGFLNQKIKTESTDLQKIIFLNDINESVNDLEKINLISLEINKSLYELIIPLRDQELLSVTKEIDKLNDNLISIEENQLSIEQNLTNFIERYNNLVNITNYQRSIIYNNLNKNETNESLIYLDKIIYDFDDHVILFNSSENLLIKESRLNLIIRGIDSYNNLIISNDSNLSFTTNLTLLDLNHSNFFLSLENFSFEFEILFPKPKCCLNNICDNCCENDCENNSLYPVLFLHGHDFNEKASAESSLDLFQDIQIKLENESYINGGLILINDISSDNPGDFGRLRKPITFSGSYYFDLLSKDGDSKIIQTKADNIETYSIRLNDIIKNVKYTTGRDKVIIVAHSMGGLVSRRYLQIFGEKDVDKIIFVFTPNHGISGSTQRYCPVLGTQLECKDMDKNSLFMNKLNNAKPNNIPFYNLIGIGVGCDIDGEIGDGVVTNASSYLDGAINIYINGSCDKSSFKYLHNAGILNNPKVYNAIKDSLIG